MQVTVHIDNTPYQQKPSHLQVSQISKRIINEEQTVAVEDLARLVGDEGRTMVLATMDGKRSKQNMKQQQVLALDFDNSTTENGKKVKTTGKDYSSVGEIYNDKFVQRYGSFIYSTFSHKENWHKFRVVFILDHPLTDNDSVQNAYETLMERFPNADKSPKDSSRLFFGGTEALEINFNNTLPVSQLIKPSKRSSDDKDKDFISHDKIDNEKARELFNAYLKKDKDNLQDYDNALSVIWVLARAAKTKEISPILARQFVIDLAMDNEQWEEENLLKFEEAMNTPLYDFHTTYTFAEKFGYKKTSKKPQADDPISMSKFLVEELDIKLFNEVLYFRQGNHWDSDKNRLLRSIDQYFETRSSVDKELIAQFKKRAELIDDKKENFPIQLRNNHFIKNGKVFEGTVDEFTPFYLDVDYQKNAYNSDVSRFLNFLTCDRGGLRKLIEEMLGHILMTSGFPHKVFFFIGSKGSNGKSTFLEMLNSWIGDLGTNISLDNFNDPTSVVELEGKLANIGDDIDASYLDKSSNFKILASGNTLMVRPIYSEPYRMKNQATLIFTANDMPSFKDKTGGIKRRLVIIPCDNTVTQADFSIDEKLSSESAKSYLLTLALRGIQRISENGGKLTETEESEALKNEYLVEENNILQFVEEIGIDEDLPDTQVYAEYKEFCIENGVRPFKKNSFTRELNDLGYEKVRKMRLGKRRYYYQTI